MGNVPKRVQKAEEDREARQLVEDSSIDKTSPDDIDLSDVDEGN